MHTFKQIRVLFIDDDVEMQDIVTSLLNFEDDINVVGCGGNGEDALVLCGELNPDVLILDVIMPGMDGVEASGLLHNQFPQVKILVLSSLQDHESIYDMLQNGASGYISKGDLFHGLPESIRAIYSGKNVFSNGVFSHLTVIPERRISKEFGLTDREIQILSLMAKGLTQPIVAEKLGIRQSTVKFHAENIYQKLGVKNRSEALVVAMKNNLL